MARVVLESFGDAAEGILEGEGQVVVCSEQRTETVRGPVVVGVLPILLDNVRPGYKRCESLSGFEEGQLAPVATALVVQDGKVVLESVLALDGLSVAQRGGDLLWDTRSHNSNIGDNAGAAIAVLGLLVACKKVAWSVRARAKPIKRNVKKKGSRGKGSSENQRTKKRSRNGMTYRT